MSPVHFLFVRNVQMREMLFSGIQPPSQAAPGLGSWTDARHSPFRQPRGCVFWAQAAPQRGGLPGPAPGFPPAHLLPEGATPNMAVASRVAASPAFLPQM